MSTFGPTGNDVAELAYVSVRVGSQLFGLPIERVHDVFVIGGLTPVPLASPEVAGLLNLRGRVVTAVDLRCRFGLPASVTQDARMAVGIEAAGETLCLVVDSVGEVLRFPARDRDDLPAHLGGGWASLASGVHRLEDELLVVLDVDRVLDLDTLARAA